MKSRLIVYPFAALILSIAAYIPSANVRSTADRELTSEETIAATTNRQILTARKLVEDYERERERADREREFNRSLYGTSEPPPEVVQQQIEKHLRKIAEDKAGGKP